MKFSDSVLQSRTDPWRLGNCCCVLLIFILCYGACTKLRIECLRNFHRSSVRGAPPLVSDSVNFSDQRSWFGHQFLWEIFQSNAVGVIPELVNKISLSYTFLMNPCVWRLHELCRLSSAFLRVLVPRESRVYCMRGFKITIFGNISVAFDTRIMIAIVYYAI